MLSKKNRFHRRNALNRVYQKGKSVRGQFCAAKFISGREGEEYRVAVVVSKKVAKSAPKRNRIRRRVYELIRELAPTYLTNQQIVITVFDDRLATMPHQELRETITKLLEQIHGK